MSRSYLVSRVDSDGPVFPMDEIVDRARERWGNSLESVHADVGDHLLTIYLSPVAEPGYAIRIEPAGEFVSTDGTAKQAASVAVWARSLLPAETPSEIWFYDDVGHTVLTSQTTESDIWSLYVDGFEVGAPQTSE